MFAPIYLSHNPYQLPVNNLLENNHFNVDWQTPTLNPNAVQILENNLKKINWNILSENLNINFNKLDVHLMRENCKPFAEELAKYVFHPRRLQKLSELYGCDMEEYFEFI
jgi:hypothetical protein